MYAAVMANQVSSEEGMYSAPAFFTAIAEDELYTATWSEIVDCDAGNTRISEESGGPQHSELVIHTSSSSFHVHIGEESPQGRSQGPSEQVTGSIPLALQGPSEQVTGLLPLQGPSEQVTGLLPLQGPSEQVTGLLPLQGPSEQVTGLVSHVASQGPSMQQQEQYPLLQEEQQHQEQKKQLAREPD